MEDLNKGAACYQLSTNLFSSTNYSHCWAALTAELTFSELVSSAPAKPPADKLTANVNINKTCLISASVFRI